MPVEDRRFQDIRIEFLTTEGLGITFEDSTTPTKVLLHFRKMTSGKCMKRGVAMLNRTFTAMHPLEVYYLHEAGRGITTPGIGPVYSAPLYLQRGHGIGNFFSCLFRWVRPLLWSGTKALRRETLRTGGKILTDIAARKSTVVVSAGKIASKHVTDSAQNLFSKLRDRGRKRAREAVAGTKRDPGGPKPQKMKRARKIIKRDTFS